MEEPTLQFLGFQVMRVAFERELHHQEGKFNVDFQELNQFSENDKNVFRSIFMVTLTSPDVPSFNLTVQCTGDFKISGEPNDYIRTNFIKISAPSIIYPYVRAFVSNLMSQSGMKPLYLPPVNFATIGRKDVEIDPKMIPPGENPPAG